MASARPNLILILADDMGFADLGLMGSEIRTPNLDALAANGVLLSAMYNCARCCPTRAALLTGLYPHRAGIGHMATDLGTPAYGGTLRDDAATIAEVLRSGGYRTLMSGKWHVGGERLPQTPPGGTTDPNLRLTPRQRGFDRFYGITDGAAHLYHPHSLMADDVHLPAPGPGYHFTDAITDHAIAMVEDAVRDEAPFFLYLAHAAPHWPLHAHAEDVARYEGVYSGGWDAVRTARHEQMLARGVLQHPWAISPRDEGAPAWPEAPHQDWEAERMAVYAAMVSHMDRSIGRLAAALRRLGQWDDTLILFLSDNGGCAEFLAEDVFSHLPPPVLATGETVRIGNRPGLRPGGPLTYMSYDLPWANVSNAPFRSFKHWVHEGGISTPMIAHWPARLPGPRIAHEACHVIDIAPTLFEAAGLRPSKDVAGREVQTLDGESLLGLLTGRRWAREQPIFWEHEGNAAVRDGPLKLVRRFGAPWELYDIEADRTELCDLAASAPQDTARLAAAYELWGEQVGVMDWKAARAALRRLWQARTGGG